MGRFTKELDRYCHAYGVSLKGKLALMAHYPLFKANWMADYSGSKAGRTAAAMLLRPFSKYSLRHATRRSTDGGAGDSATVRVSFARNDFASFKEVLWAECYQDVLKMGPVETFVDLGANTGQATVYFAARSALRHALLVEANGRLIPTITANLAGMPTSVKFDVEHACVMAEDGESIAFGVSDNHRHSHVISETATVGDDSVVLQHVPRRSLRSLLKQHGLKQVDVMKIDIEGAEHDLINDPESIRATRILVMEVHGQLTERDAFASKLQQIGFRFTARPRDAANCEVLVAQRI